MAAPRLLALSDTASLQATLSFTSLTQDEFATLSKLSSAAKSKAYCPYSNFRVGAAVLVAPSAGAEVEPENKPENKRKNKNKPATPPVYVSGANVENAAYPVGTCAERAAISRAVVDGHRRLRAVAVATDITPPASPCGMCRQFIREFCEPSTPIIMFDKNLDYVVMTLEQLLPMSFGPDSLRPPEAMEP